MSCIGTVASMQGDNYQVWNMLAVGRKNTKIRHAITGDSHLYVCAVKWPEVIFGVRPRFFLSEGVLSLRSVPEWKTLIVLASLEADNSSAVPCDTYIVDRSLVHDGLALLSSLTIMFVGSE